MQGAAVYAKLFKTGQYGRLYIDSGFHARGKTFHMWALHDDSPIVVSHPRSLKDAVEVYGITGGHPGWTEIYGWLHHGKWESDFSELVEKRKAEIESDIAHQDYIKSITADNEKQRIEKLLASYE